MKTGRNDPCPCGSGNKYKKCCLEKEETNLRGENLLIYKCWISQPKGSKIAVISRIKHNGNYEMASMLVDEWKMGLKDGFGKYDFTQDQLDEYISRADFQETTLDECKKLIKRGILIAKNLGFRLPKEYEQCKEIIGNIDDTPINGSLYKCYACGKNDLSEKIISRIKEVTLNDVREGICGTEDESMIYFTCDNCKKRKTVAHRDEYENETLEEDDLWEDEAFTETISVKDMNDKIRTITMDHDTEMNFNCSVCNTKISAHNKEWHAGMCDTCFDRK